MMLLIKPEFNLKFPYIFITLPILVSGMVNVGCVPHKWCSCWVYMRRDWPSAAPWWSQLAWIWKSPDRSKCLLGFVPLSPQASLTLLWRTTSSIIQLKIKKMWFDMQKTILWYIMQDKLTFGCQQLFLFVVKCLKVADHSLICLCLSTAKHHFFRFFFMYTCMLAKEVCGASLILSLSFCCAARSAARSLPGALLSATGPSDELDSASDRRQSELVELQRKQYYRFHLLLYVHLIFSWSLKMLLCGCSWLSQWQSCPGLVCNMAHVAANTLSG